MLASMMFSVSLDSIDCQIRPKGLFLGSFFRENVCSTKVQILITHIIQRKAKADERRPTQIFVFLN